MLELKNYCNAIIANTEVPPNAEAQAQDRRKTTRPSNSKPPSHRYYINQTGRSPLPSNGVLQLYAGESAKVIGWMGNHRLP